MTREPRSCVTSAAVAPPRRWCAGPRPFPAITPDWPEPATQRLTRSVLTVWRRAATVLTPARVLEWAAGPRTPLPAGAHHSAPPGRWLPQSRRSNRRTWHHD